MANAVFLIYPISQESFSHSNSFKNILYLQRRNCFLDRTQYHMHPFHILGLTDVFDGSLFSVMYGSLVISNLVRKTTENEFTNENYRFGQEEETCYIVAVYGYFVRLIF